MAARDPGHERRSPALAVAAVAQRLGVAPATLRTWDRRYGLGPSEHVAGAHRRYTRSDVERLMVMRRLTLAGVAPGEAARAALGEAPADLAVLGGHVSPSTVVDAALAGDVERLAAAVRVGDDDDVVTWWTDLIGPARDALARRTVLDRPGRDAELALRVAVLGAVDRVARRRPVHPAAGVLLLLGPPGAPRPLVLHAIAAAVPTTDARAVSGPTSAHHLVELVTMTRARAVVTVAERLGDDLGLVGSLAAERPDLPQLVLVPAGDFGRIPTGPAVQRARSVAGLIHELRALLAADHEDVR